MKEMVEYKFESVLNKNVTVIIKSYSYEAAMHYLEATVFYVDDFIYKP